MKFANLTCLKNLLFNGLHDIPKYSCLIEIKFKLKKIYLSKEDDSFYIIDNPVVKEKVFKLPMVRATIWKGVLRFAALKVFEEELYNRTITENSWKEKELCLLGCSETRRTL